MTADDVQRAIWRIAHEIVERNHGLDDVVLIGLQTGGVPARRPAGRRRSTGSSRQRRARAARSTSRFYRDDIGLRPVLPEAVTDIPVDLDRHASWCSSTTCSSPAAPSGPRSTRSTDYGRPRAVQLAVHGRPRPPRAADPARLRRQEPADPRATRWSTSRPTASTRRVVSLAARRPRVTEHLLLDRRPRRATASTSCSPHRSASSRSAPAPIPKVPALRGKTVVSLFYEDSTRTRLSFETAAKRLSADTMTFSVGTSSVKKGEIAARHRADDRGHGRRRHRRAPRARPACRGRSPRGSTSAVINAGDGWHEHPTQALLDCYTIRAAPRRSLDGLHIAIVGDIKHSRVARSDVLAFTALGAEVTLVAPPTLLPPSLDGWPVDGEPRPRRRAARASTSCYLLRMQRERMTEALRARRCASTPPRYGLTAERAPTRCAEHALVMHPGPMNRGVEIAAEVADAAPTSVVTDQVAQRRRRAHGGAVPAARLRASTSGATGRRRRSP